MPVEPPIRTLSPVSGAISRTTDPRYRRTRAQICAATRRLLESRVASRLTFAMVAEAAEVNRSTVHQHYASRHELVADALAGDLASIAEPLERCPFGRTRSGPARSVPAELVEMFTAVRDQRAILDRLDSTEACLVTDRLTGLLTAQLVARFTAGARPRGFDRVPPEVHARFVAAGLVGLLLVDNFADDEAEPADLAKQAWQLITPVRT